MEELAAFFSFFTYGVFFFKFCGTIFFPHFFYFFKITFSCFFLVLKIIFFFSYIGRDLFKLKNYAGRDKIIRQKTKFKNLLIRFQIGGWGQFFFTLFFSLDLVVFDWVWGEISLFEEALYIGPPQKCVFFPGYFFLFPQNCFPSTRRFSVLGQFTVIFDFAKTPILSRPKPFL